MAATLWFAMGPEAAWLGGGIVTRALHLGWVVIAGASAYFAALWLVGIKPRDFVKRGVE